jgi:Carboxypeptidase regulatory-like domain
MRKLLVVLLFCCFFTTMVAARAQQTLGSLNGTVVDASGAAVPDSTVTATDASIGVTRTTKAQGNGYFQIFNLPVGTYSVKATHDGFDTTELTGIEVQEAGAKTVNFTLKVGQISQSIQVTANPMLNATDATNGYTMDSEQIALTPLATGSFTQLAVLSPGVSAELLSNLDSNAGLGNQPIWANGQRDTSNTFQVNGVDATNLFNGKSSSGSNSQRYGFNIGETGKIGGAFGVGTSVFGSNGNSLPSPPPEFLQELRVNTSLYDAQQGATSGAQIDANTASGTNTFHGQMYGSFANNSLNAAPYFFKQDYLLAQQGIGAFPESLANPALHRWSTGLTLGGPIKKDKLFFFVGYQHRYNSDQGTGLSQMTVPSGLTDDRSMAGLENALGTWKSGLTLPSSSFSPIALALLNAKLPNGQFLIPSAQISTPVQYNEPNVTLIGTSILVANQATASVDYDVTKTDRLSVKYYYQNDPVSKPFGLSETGGFPVTQNNGAQVAAIDNTITIGSRINWEQRLGFDRLGSYSFYTQTLPVSTATGATGANYGIGAGFPGLAGGLPGLDLEEFAYDGTSSPGLTTGPDSAFVNEGYFQNRLNPSTNVILALGKHTIVAGGSYAYTQLNIENNRQGVAELSVTNFEDFLEGTKTKSSVLESDAGGHNLSNRYYRTNEAAGYVQDKWQALPNLSITAGVRYDYHGGLTEKLGDLFNFDPSAYNVTGTSTTGFTVNNSGFVVAGNNKTDPTPGTSDSTLTGRQWGISPRVGFAYSPKMFKDKVVINGGAGLYYDRGELFTYLSQPAGSGAGGPFGVTESSPLATLVTGNGTTLANPLGTAIDAPPTGTFVAPNSNPATINTALQTVLNRMTGSTHPASGPNCGGVDGQANFTDCPTTLNFGAYDPTNVLPYSINFALNVQWQPRNDLAITIGYNGNRGRHAVIPFPINEPGIATASNPIHGETSTYGFEVLNQNKVADADGDFAPIGSEPWDTEDGGNTDFRAPYVGFNPNAADFKTAGTSAYDSLQIHVEKRLSHHIQGGVNYTYGHALDEQSDIGLFFTGNNPQDLRQSYASSDFDRTHVFTANFLAELPNMAPRHSWLSYLVNDWSMTGIGVIQSGEPYSLYEFDGAVDSINFGNFPDLLNPVLPISNPKAAKTTALTGNPGDRRGSGGNFIPTINPSDIAINYVTPGTSGVPTAAQGNAGDPVDIYETNFAPTNQRNIFRQSMQKRLDLSFRKNIHVTSRYALEYQFNIFNVTNTTSLDIPQNQTQIRQSSACSTSATLASSENNCPQNSDFLQFGQIVTSPLTADQQSALNNLDEKPYFTGSGKTIQIPTEIPVGAANAQGVVPCAFGTIKAPGTTGVSACPNNGDNFGSVQNTIGGGRAITMELHLVF